VPRCLSEIQSPPPQGHPAPASASEPILLVTMPGVAETFKSVSNELTYRTDFKPFNLLQALNWNLTHEDLNTSIDEPENQWNVHLVSYETSTSQAKQSSQGQL